MKKCLIISPLHFYSWHTAISNEFVARDYVVEVMNDEYPQGVIGTILGTLFNKLARELTYIKYKKYLSCSHSKFDVVIIFKGRGISSELINLLSKNSKKVIAYNFDSFDYSPYPLNWMDKVDSYKTFDFKDSLEYQIEKVDLFSGSRFENFPLKENDFSCVMKNHSQRLKYLDEIYGILSDSYSFDIHIFEKNIFTYLKGFLTNPILFYKWRKCISFKSLNTHDYEKALSSSIYTLDYAHPSQTGITMRCFQAQACGAKIITNNKYCLSSTAMNKQDIFVHELGGNGVLLKSFIEKNIKKKPIAIHRGISEFVDELLI